MQKMLLPGWRRARLNRLLYVTTDFQLQSEVLGHIPAEDAFQRAAIEGTAKYLRSLFLLCCEAPHSQVLGASPAPGSRGASAACHLLPSQRQHLILCLL